MSGPRTYPPAIERFEANIERIPFSGCWIWMASGLNGYGRFGVSGKTTLAHRFSYTNFVGPVPHGLHVLHHCDVPECCNPAHLYAGTDADNADDRIRRGRIFKPAAKTHCIKGHAFTRENTDQFGKIKNCKECNRKSAREYQARLRAARNIVELEKPVRSEIDSLAK